MRIAVAYRGIPNRKGWETGAAMVRAFRRLGHDAQPWAKVYQENRWLMPTWDPGSADLLLACECNDAEPQYDFGMFGNCPRVYWEFDTAMHPDSTAQFIAESKFDLVYMANRRFCKDFGARYLPYAFPDDLMVPSQPEKKGAAIVGTPFPLRQAFADKLGVEVVTGKLNGAYVDAICSLLVHVHHHDSGGEGLIVMRPFETMGLGTCLLTQYSAELESLFSDGVHCSMYNTPAHAAELLDWLLNRPSEAMEIGKRGRQEILAKHTYTHRARHILAEALS